MTIAACAVTPEGVVLGADSTSTLTMGDAQRYLDNEQKLFEIGEPGRVGIVTWGLGRIGATSYRTLIAKLADEVAATTPAPTSVEAVAKMFSANVWRVYDATLRAEITKQQAIVTGTGSQADKSKALAILENFGVGFCLAGHCLPGREPEAYKIYLSPSLTAAPNPEKVTGVQFWGANLFIFRALGLDRAVAQEILASKKWSGKDAELMDLFDKHRMPIVSPLPLRETIDLVHAMLHMTIKLIKFTSVPPLCGGHIEIATVTTDRGFRWVRHKTLGAALDHP